MTTPRARLGQRVYSFPLVLQSESVGEFHKTSLHSNKSFSFHSRFIPSTILFVCRVRWSCNQQISAASFSSPICPTRPTNRVCWIISLPSDQSKSCAWRKMIKISPCATGSWLSLTFSPLIIWCPNGHTWSIIDSFTFNVSSRLNVSIWIICRNTSASILPSTKCLSIDCVRVKHAKCLWITFNRLATSSIAGFIIRRRWIRNRQVMLFYALRTTTAWVSSMMTTSQIHMQSGVFFFRSNHLGAAASNPFENLSSTQMYPSRLQLHYLIYQAAEPK